MRELVLVACCVAFSACSGQRNGRRYSNPAPDGGGDQASLDLAVGPGGDLAVGQGDDLAVVPTDGGALDGKGGDLAATAVLTGTILLRRGAQETHATASFEYVSPSSTPAMCVDSDGCRACWTGPVVAPDMTPADLSAPPADLLRPDLWSADLLAQPDLWMVTPNAGNITVSKTKFPISLTTTSTGAYVGSIFNFPQWNGQTTLHVAAVGGAEVPSFSADHDTPTEGALTVAPSVIDRSQPYAMKWPVGEGVVNVEINTIVSVGYSYATVRCSFDRASGQAVIPPAVLSHLYATADGYNTKVTFDYETSTHLTAGKAQIDIVSTVAVSGPGGPNALFTTE